jgi:hypothetical protein
VEYVEPPPPWEEGRQDILNALEAQMPQHTFKRRCRSRPGSCWAEAGEQWLDMVAVGWVGDLVKVDMWGTGHGLNVVLAASL